MLAKFLRVLASIKILNTQDTIALSGHSHGFFSLFRSTFVTHYHRLLAFGLARKGANHSHAEQFSRRKAEEE